MEASRSRNRVISAVIAIALIGWLWILARHSFGWGEITSPYGRHAVLGFSANEARFFIVLTLVQALLVTALIRATPARADRAFALLSRKLLARPSRTIFALALISAAIALTFAIFTTGLHPISEDEKTYLFQSELLRSGHLVTSAMPDEAKVFLQPFIATHDGHWTGQFFWAYPAILMIFAALGSPWIASPIALALTVWFSAHAASTLCDDARVGVLTAALMATSPFLLLNAATLLNVNLAATCIAASLWGIAQLRDRPSRIATIVLGVSTGIAIHNRPLDHAAFIITVAALLLAEHPRSMIATIRLYLPSIAISIPFLVAIPIINKAISGDAMIGGYGMFNGHAGWKTMGFGIGPFGWPQTPASAASKTIVNFTRVVFFISGSSIVVALASIGALFAKASSRMKAVQRSAGVVVVAHFAVYLFYISAPISPAGPVYFVSIAPIVIVWLAVAIISLRDALRTIAPASMWLPKTLIALTAIATFTFWPSAILELHRVATQTPAARAERLARENDLHHALIFVAPPSHAFTEYWEYALALPHPSFDDDILYARIGDKDLVARAAARYGVGRDIYLIESKDPLVMTLEHFDPTTGMIAPFDNRR